MSKNSANKCPDGARRSEPPPSHPPPAHGDGASISSAAQEHGEGAPASPAAPAGDSGAQMGLGAWFVSNHKRCVDWTIVVQGQLQSPYICRTCTADFNLRWRRGQSPPTEPQATHQGGRIHFFPNNYYSGKCPKCNVYWQRIQH